jgi:hypothetical protein
LFETKQKKNRERENEKEKEKGREREREREKTDGGVEVVCGDGFGGGGRFCLSSSRWCSGVVWRRQIPFFSLSFFGYEWWICLCCMKKMVCLCFFSNF